MIFHRFSVVLKEKKNKNKKKWRNNSQFSKQTIKEILKIIHFILSKRYIDELTKITFSLIQLAS